MRTSTKQRDNPNCWFEQPVLDNPCATHGFKSSGLCLDLQERKDVVSGQV
jgi:hypothetical protein